MRFFLHFTAWFLVNLAGAIVSALVESPSLNYAAGMFTGVMLIAIILNFLNKA